ncbi:unnamed protein product [Peronospora effusa]|nr:unnamed protein product [Peronospora effusa]
MDPRRPRNNVSDNQNWEHQAKIRREQAPQVMDGDLKPWRLYGLEGAVEPRATGGYEGPLHVISYSKRQSGEHRIYRRCVAEILVCLHLALDASGRKGTSFTSWLDGREGSRDRHAIGDLRRCICRMTCDEYNVYYVHVREGCPTCIMGISRPVWQEWDNFVCTRGMFDHIRPWIARYKRSL